MRPLQVTIWVLALIAALGHDRFAVRERAQLVLSRLEKLAGLGDLLSPDRYADPEVSRRIALIPHAEKAAREGWQNNGDLYWMELPNGNKYYIRPGRRNDGSWEACAYIGTTKRTFYACYDAYTLEEAKEFLNQCVQEYGK
jgi:hypothetical protein